jgi:hypothetical protein
MSDYEATDADIAAALDDLVAITDEVTGRQNKRGPKTTIIHFRGEKQICTTAKAGYVATLNRFIEAKSALVTYTHVIETSARRYIARNKKDLYPRSPHLGGIRSYSRQLENGWWAITNLNTRENVELLCRFGLACGLEFGIDWDFEPLDPTEETSDARVRERINQEMIARALADLDAIE